MNEQRQALLERLASDVELMRRYQVEYFQSRTSDKLRDAKQMERRVDATVRELRDLKNKPPSLF